MSPVISKRGHGGNGKSKHQRTRSGSPPPGRIRQYAPTSSPLSTFNPTSPDTPEGALTAQNSADWHVPTGDERWFQDDDRMREIGIDPVVDDRRSRRASDKYRASDFWVPATDERGHDKHIDVAFSTEMMNEMAAVVRSRKWPLEDIRHFVRTACFELLRVLEHMEPIENSHVAILEQMNQINEDTNVLLAYERRVQIAIESIELLLGRGMENRARVKLHDQIEAAKAIKDRELREMILERLRSRFRGMLRGKPVDTRPRRRVVDADD